MKTSCLIGTAISMLFLRPSNAGLKKSMGTMHTHTFLRQDVFILTGPSSSKLDI